MICSLEDLKEKDVINVCNGENLGYVDDIQLETNTSAIKSLIIYGKPKYFGLFGAKENYLIPFERIQLIGKDVILVSLNFNDKNNNMTEFYIKKA